MLRYEPIGQSVISVDLHNGYIVMGIAKWYKEQELYRLSLYIREKTTYMWDLMDEFDEVKLLDSNKRTINRDMANFITEQCHNKKIEYYVKRYEEFLDRCELGTEIMEKRRTDAS